MAHSDESLPRSDLSIPVIPFVAVLFGVGVVLIVLGGILFDPLESPPIFSLALGCYASAALVWGIAHWRPVAGRWFTLLVFALLPYAIAHWVAGEAALPLMVIPVVLGAPLVGLWATLAVAGFETALLLFWPLPVLSTSPTYLITTLVAIWAIPAVLYAAYRPVYQLADWSWDNFRRARVALDEARNRQMALRQALDDLAHANRQLTLLNENLADLRLVAEQAQRTKTAFLSKVSHEFRTPLNMIIGLIDVLIETPEIYGAPLSPRLMEHLQIVNRNCEHLASLVNDVLDLTQVEAGRLALHREHLDLRDIIDRALSVVRPLTDKKGLYLTIDIPDALPKVYGDRTRIAQVIVNLLSNSARFTDRGGIAVQVDTNERDVVINVADTGPGIPDEDREVIFEPFCQGISHSLRDRGGAGWG